MAARGGHRVFLQTDENDADHFTVYHPPVVEKVVADQLGFLAVHLTQ